MGIDDQLLMILFGEALPTDDSISLVASRLVDV